LHYFFSLNKTAVELHQLLEAFGEAVPVETTCGDWFRQPKSSDFNVKDKELAERPKMVEKTDLKAS